MAGSETICVGIGYSKLKHHCAFSSGYSIGLGIFYCFRKLFLSLRTDYLGRRVILLSHYGVNAEAYVSLQRSKKNNIGVPHVGIINGASIFSVTFGRA